MRASDRRRERVVSVLGDGYAHGCLGTETHSFRVDAALHARTVEDLRALVADLPARLRRRVSWLPVGASAPAAVTGRDRAVRIAPPPDGPGPWTIGRGPDCRLVIDADTVSRAHAELRRVAVGRLEIRDLGSTNGTWVNGWRVGRATIAPGDDVRLGDVRIVF